jgi:hypothetical protein
MHKNIFSKRKIILILVVLFCILGFSSYPIYPFPEKDTLSVMQPESFIISKTNRFEIQPPNKCAAYATAFILRNFGLKAKGSEVYKEMSFKIPFSGYVFPKGILTYFESKELKAKLFKGDLETLKRRLAKGEPIMVLIGQSYRWQHYMTLVGYESDKKELYFYDSKKKYDENGKLPGNRTLKEDYFLTLWDNGLPIFNHIYMEVNQ